MTAAAFLYRPIEQRVLVQSEQQWIANASPLQTADTRRRPAISHSLDFNNTDLPDVERATTSITL